MHKNIVVCISGAGSNLENIIFDIKNNNRKINIALVVSSKPNVLGLEIAKKHNIKSLVLEPKNYANTAEYGKQLHKNIAEYKPNLIVLAGFMLILNDTFVKQWLGKLINIHPSLLPKYKGLNTHQQAIDNKDDLHGVTVHFVEPELDAGPIILQMACSMQGINTAENATKKVQALEKIIYPVAINGCLSGEYTYKPTL